MKPIDPGCLCLYVGKYAKFAGMQCTAVRICNPGELVVFGGVAGLFMPSDGKFGWLIDFGSDFGFTDEKNLIRLDGHAPDRMINTREKVTS